VSLRSDPLPRDCAGPRDRRLVAWVGPLASLAIATLCAGCSPQVSGASSPSPTVTRAPLIDRQLLTGELTAERAVEITAPDVGIRPLEIRWMVDNGTPVQAGDPLFEFNNATLASRLLERRAAVDDVRAAIASIESQAGSKVSEAEFAVERRRTELEKARIDAAIPPGLRSAEEYERLQTAARMAERRLADAERLLQTTRSTTRAEIEKERLRHGKEEAELRQVEGGITRLAVKAPIAGIALVRNNAEQERAWDVGDVVYPGHRLASLPDPSTMIVRARLFDVDDGVLEPGLPATVTLDAYPDLEFRGRVRSIERMAFESDRNSSTRIFWVVVELEKLDLEHMRPGMSVKVVVERDLTAGKGALVAPRRSLDLSDPAAPRALLADGSWQPVEIGACSALDCVVESGLTEGAALGRIGASGEGS
jgi:multidrug resistance efflux pump